MQEQKRGKLRLRYKKGDIGIQFASSLKNCADDSNFTKTLENQWIVFYKPNGVRVEKEASVEVIDSDDVIVYLNDTEPSILDVTGAWEYAPKIKYVVSGKTKTIESAQSVLFWVV